jgi:acyl-CoA reductase-like NAD-dependent aldehyde dehydrogenase
MLHSSFQSAQANQQVLSRLPLTTEAEFNAAVQAAKDAFPK